MITHMRAYRAAERDVASGHVPGRWYHRPRADAGTAPASPPFLTLEEAVRDASWSRHRGREPAPAAPDYGDLVAGTRTETAPVKGGF